MVKREHTRVPSLIHCLFDIFVSHFERDVRTSYHLSWNVREFHSLHDFQCLVKRWNSSTDGEQLLIWTLMKKNNAVSMTVQTSYGSHFGFVDFWIGLLKFNICVSVPVVLLLLFPCFYQTTLQTSTNESDFKIIRLEYTILTRLNICVILRIRRVISSLRSRLSI